MRSTSSPDADLRRRRWCQGPLLDTEEAAEYTRRPTMEAFRAFAARKGLKPVKLGRSDLWRKSEIDALLQTAVDHRRLRMVR